ncbi:MAG: HlyD family efflux transporter periplasmic adaptor subunit [Myxococcales bacterium]|nr:HlyD family efflux transporter periplasmic adaptor subunit [Myxococcales bacterium]
MALQPSTPKTRRRRFNRRSVMRWVKRVALVLGGVGIAVVIVRTWMPKPIEVELGRVARMPLDVEVDEEGQTRVRDRFVISAPIGGTLQRIELEPGMMVEAGATVAAIEPSPPALLDERTRREATARLDAALAHERVAGAAIARAQTARDAAVREADRTRTLVARGAVAAAERDRAETEEQLAIRALAAAKAERLAAAAEVSAARAILGTDRAGTARSSLAVTSPVRGAVLRVLRESTGPVMPGAPLLELGDLGALEIVVDVLSSDAARILPGMRCHVGGWGGDRELLGTVRRVEPSAFTRISALGVEEQRVKVIVTLDQAPPTLGDGFRVNARIVTWHADDVLVVPASAVFRDRERWAVYVVDDDKARLVPIELGHRGRLFVEVRSGVTAGMQLVLHPSDRVRDGASVAAAPR